MINDGTISIGEKVMRKLVSKMDIPLFIMVVLYISLGLVMIYSASNITAVVRYGYASAT